MLVNIRDGSGWEFSLLASAPPNGLEMCPSRSNCSQISYYFRGFECSNSSEEPTVGECSCYPGLRYCPIVGECHLISSTRPRRWESIGQNYWINKNTHGGMYYQTADRVISSLRLFTEKGATAAFEEASSCNKDTQV